VKNQTDHAVTMSEVTTRRSFWRWFVAAVLSDALVGLIGIAIGGTLGEAAISAVAVAFIVLVGALLAPRAGAILFMTFVTTSIVVQIVSDVSSRRWWRFVLIALSVASLACARRGLRAARFRQVAEDRATTPTARI
jgi:hypothetical protein